MAHPVGDRRGFTLIEVLSVLAVIAIVAAMLMPAFSRAREMGRRAACLSNLKQIGLAASMYSQDYDEMSVGLYLQVDEPVPGAFDGCPQSRKYWSWWGESLQPYLKNTQVFVCPSQGSPQQVADPHFGGFNDCPIDGGGGPSKPLPGIPSGCPKLLPHVHSPLFYSYAMNGLNQRDIWWSKTSGLASGRHGFNLQYPTPDCVLSEQAQAISTVAVQVPSDTIMIVDAEYPESDGLKSPQLRANVQLDYLTTEEIDEIKDEEVEDKKDEERLSRRHHEGSNALFADGHSKWIKFGSSRPAQWSVQED